MVQLDWEYEVSKTYHEDAYPSTGFSEQVAR